MEILFAFLADAAETSSQGKVHAFGAGIDRILGQTLPAVVTPIYFAAQVLIQPDEVEREHVVRLDIEAPDGSVLTQVSEGTWTPQPDPLMPEEPLKGVMVIGMLGLEFPQIGNYTVRLLVDGDRLVGLPLRVRLIPGAEANRLETEVD